jgi:hypothetical protein
VGIESNLALDALPLSDGNGTTIHLDIRRADFLSKVSGAQVKLSKSQGRTIYFAMNERCLTIGIGSFLRFELDLSSNQIYGKALNIVPEELIRYWVLQQVVPLFLLWNGSLEFLHGMAVSVGSASVHDGSQLIGSPCMGFVGDSYAGKSTLLSYFLSRGHALVSDEHLALSRQSYRDVVPAIPYYRPYRAGEDLGHVSSSFSSESRPLQRIFLLEPAPFYADVEFHSLTGLAAVSALMRHAQYSIYNSEMQHLFPLVAERFKGLAQLAREFSVKRLYIPRSIDRLPEVYDLLSKELAR